MSRMHYNYVASLIAGERALAKPGLSGGDRAVAAAEAKLETTRNLALSLADFFRQDNSRFDRERFYTAAGIEDPYSSTGLAS